MMRGLGCASHDARSCRAWLYGKLVVALLAEKLVDSAESFFSWGYDIDSISEEPAA
jgi:hypothetical protein